MTREQVKKIAAHADIDVRTVTSFVAGLEVRGASERRIVKAAKALKIALPRRK